MSKEVSFKNHDRFVQLGIAISTLRRMRGLSQEKLAEKAGITLPFCAAIETERKAPSAFTLRNMADRLGVTVDYFLYQDSVQAEIKMISEQLADKPAAYVELIGRLIAVCNDFNDTK